MRIRRTISVLCVLTILLSMLTLSASASSASLVSGGIKNNIVTYTLTVSDPAKIGVIDFRAIVTGGTVNAVSSPNTSDIAFNKGAENTKIIVTLPAGRAVSPLTVKINVYTTSDQVSLKLSNLLVGDTHGNKLDLLILDSVTANKVLSSNKYNVTSTRVSKISESTSVSAFLSSLDYPGQCKIYKGSTQVSGSTKVGTGMRVHVIKDGRVSENKEIIVTGDTNGDGVISVTDMISIKSALLRKSSLSGPYAVAADTSGDNKISVTDFIQIKAKLLKKGTITPR